MLKSFILGVKNQFFESSEFISIYKNLFLHLLDILSYNIKNIDSKILNSFLNYYFVTFPSIFLNPIKVKIAAI